METGTALSPIAVGTNHLALIAGLPASLTYLATDLCRDMLARQHGACETVVLNDLGTESVERVAAAVGPVIFLGEVPDRAVAEMVREAAFPVIVLEQGYAAASLDYMAARGAAVQDAARTMARSQIGLDGLLAVPRTATVSIGAEESVVALVERMARVLGIDPAIVKQMVAERHMDRPLPEVLDEICGYEEQTRDEDVKTALGQLERFYGPSHDGLAPVLDVPLVMLVEGTAPHLPATDPIDLVGPARCLTFGPFVHLPRGRWKARFTFRSTENKTTNSIGFDIAADQEIKVDQSFNITASGTFAFDCEFEIRDPYYYWEFRTFLRRGSIEGTFHPLALRIEWCGHATHEPVPAEPAPNVLEFDGSAVV